MVVAQTISHYGLWFSLGLVALVVFFQIRAQRHIMRNAGQSGPGQADATGGAEATGADAGA